MKAAKVANVIFIGGGVVFALAFAYIYRQGHQFSGASALYYCFAISGFFSCVVCLWLKPETRINLALLAVSSVFVIYGLETALAVLNFSSDMQAERASKAQVKEKLNYLLELREKGIDAYPAVSPRLLLRQRANGRLGSAIKINGNDILPLGGISSKTIVYCNENGYFTVYESDEYGFHNPPSVWSMPEISIAAIGDSFTHGACVPSDKNFVALIRKSYLGTVNLGASGNGPLAELATLREYAAHIKPKIVLWFYYEGNDVIDLEYERNSEILINYLKDERFTQGLFKKNRQVKIDLALKDYVKEAEEKQKRPLEETKIDSGKMLDITQEIFTLRNIRYRVGFVNKDMFLGDVDHFREVLASAQEIVDSWGGKIYFVYLPSWERYSRSDQRQLIVMSGMRKKVIDLTRNLGLKIIDIKDKFDSLESPLKLFPNQKKGHYTEEGNRLVAEQVLRAISPRMN